MEAIKRRFILPVEPRPTHVKTVYPWESNYLELLYNQLYVKAQSTGYIGTLEEFKNDLGNFMSIANDIITYDGEYIITPMADFDQVLKTKQALLADNIVIEKIPIIKTSNNANGYTAIIG